MKSRIILILTMIAVVLNLVVGQHQAALALFTLVQVIAVKGHSARLGRNMVFFDNLPLNPENHEEPYE